MFKQTLLIGSLVLIGVTALTEADSTPVSSITLLTGQQVTLSSDNTHIVTPLLAISNIEGNWLTPTLPSTITSGEFIAGTCSGQTATSVCFAVGIDTSSGNSETLIYMSQNGGVTWTIPDLSNVGFPSAGSLSSVACDGDGANAHCFIAGELDGNGAVTLITTDGGNTWTTGDPYYSKYSTLLSATCGNQCFATGLDYGTENILGFIAFADSAIALDEFSGAWFMNSDCVEDSCIAVGANATGGFITSSTNYWATSAEIYSGNFGGINDTFYGASCATADNNNPCVAVGISENDITTPLIYVNANLSEDTLNNWSAATISPSNLEGSLYSVSCTPGDTDSVCIAVGISNPGTPFILKSLDSGKTWTQEQFSSGGPGSLLGVACSNNADIINCTASGMGVNLSAMSLVPIAYTNPDVTGADIWVSPTNLTLPASGCLLDAGSNGHSNGAYLEDMSCVLGE
jgi:hypothetical protein